MQFSIVYPSRGRPGLFDTTFRHWVNAMSGEVPLQVIVSLDSDDPTLPDYTAVTERLRNEFEGRVNLQVLCSDNDCVVAAVNRAVPGIQGDVVVVVSDDFECPEAWDLKLIQRIPEDRTLFSILVYDGVQSFIPTLPVLSRSFIELTGYIYYPEYRSLYADEDLGNECTLRGIQVDARDLLFPHHHYTVTGATPDQTYRKENSSEYRELGRELNQQRARVHYAVSREDRLPYLTLFICTSPEHKALSTTLQNTLREQAVQLGVEIGVDLEILEDSAGKRGEALTAATGLYALWLQAEDQLAGDFLERLLHVIREKPYYDRICLPGTCLPTGTTGFFRRILRSWFTGAVEASTLPDSAVPVRTHLLRRVVEEHPEWLDQESWFDLARKAGIVMNERVIEGTPLLTRVGKGRV